ncbi:transcriptional antiterminator/mannitol/fructose-specific phosphotransferase system IIA component (Ntr-type) [Enterococcus rotai]|uniref:Transcription antiterminator BglG n=1 Tax=Enterococcus rotai TaxID=118060 RepID=A0A0U2XFB5_9ENTE|nr:BglG family transcription antiterminator [Enterococcus rotai]ALS35981.1 transcription antiterminator BglG [Enterococcus rotai]
MKDRTIQIFKRFIWSDYPLTLSELSEDFRISNRTLRNEIKEINAFLDERNLPEIKTIRNRGMRLNLEQKERELLDACLDEKNEFNYLNREERIFDLILAFSLSEQPVFLYQKESDYQISKSTMDEDMRRVRTILLEYGIEVLSIPKQGIILKGSERTIRTMIYDVINQSIDSLRFLEGNESGLSNSEKHLFRYIPKQILKKIDQIYHQTISSREDLYRNQLVMFTAIWLSRYLRQELIVNSSWEVVENGQNKLHTFIDRLCRTLAVRPPSSEINYISFMLETFNTGSIRNSVEWVQAQVLSIQLIQFVEQTTKIPFSKKEESLHEGLYRHMAGLISRVKSEIQILNPLKETVKRYYGNIYFAIEKFAPTIEAITKNELSEDEMAFLTIHFSTSVSAINQELTYTYKAVVICNHGTATGRLLAEHLKELFNIDVLAVLSTGEMDLIKKLDVDLIFSTLSLTYPEKPILVVDPIIKVESRKNIQAFLEQNKQYKRLINNDTDSTELFYRVLDLIKESGGMISNEIYKNLEKTFDQNHLKINKRELQPMLKDVLKKSDILLLEKCPDWESAIQRVACPLLKENAIEESYIDAMIASVKEFGPYIVMGKHLALAHARPEDGVNKLGISVATLAEPVVFGNEENDPVKIIFCLAAVDSFSHLNIMKSLIELINDETKIDRLAQCTTVADFETILYEDALNETKQ